MKLLCCVPLQVSTSWPICHVLGVISSCDNMATMRTCGYLLTSAPRLLKLPLLPPWRRVLLEKPLVSQLVKKFRAFCGIWSFRYRVHEGTSLASVPSHMDSACTKQYGARTNFFRHSVCWL